MAINWSLGQQPNALAMMLQGFEQGKEMRAKEKSRNALNSLLMGGNPARTPGIGDDIPGNKRMDGSTVPYADLTPEDARTALQFQGQQRQQQVAQAKTQEDQLVRLGRLLDYAKDPQTYSQALQAAQQSGLDVSKAPQQYDPNWIAQQKLVISQYQADGGQQISGLARELQDAGYQPGTPEFQQAMTTALQGKYAPQYTDQQGNLRQARLPDLPQQAQAAKPQIIPTRPAGMSDADLFEQAREAVANGADRNTVFEQLQAWGVKP